MYFRYLYGLLLLHHIIFFCNCPGVAVDFIYIWKSLSHIFIDLRSWPLICSSLANISLWVREILSMRSIITVQMLVNLWLHNKFRSFWVRHLDLFAKVLCGQFCSFFSHFWFRFWLEVARFLSIDKWCFCSFPICVLFHWWNNTA